MNHTPGPWIIWGEPGTLDVAVGPVSGGVAVAQVVATTGAGFITAESSKRAEANAHLIAAAPALVAALQSMIDHAGLPSLDPAYRQAIKSAVAALALARGQA